MIKRRMLQGVGALWLSRCFHNVSSSWFSVGANQDRGIAMRILPCSVLSSKYGQNCYPKKIRWWQLWWQNQGFKTVVHKPIRWHHGGSLLYLSYNLWFIHTTIENDRGTHWNCQVPVACGLGGQYWAHNEKTTHYKATQTQPFLCKLNRKYFSTL